MKLTNFNGENVDTAISMIRGAISRLKTVEPPRVPSDIQTQLLHVFQTSSEITFNDHFKQVEQQYNIDVATHRKGSTLLSVGDILTLAASLYRARVEKGTWSGVSRKVNETAFVAGKPVCWNCGTEGHTLADCPKPKNQQLIKANRSKFMKAVRENRKNKKGTGSNSSGSPPAPGTGKWRAPEPNENNRRVIDGKHYFYKKQTRRWVPDRAFVAQLPTSSTSTTPGTSSSTPPSLPTGTPTDPSPAPSAGPPALEQHVNLAIANATRQMTQTLQGLGAAFSASHNSP